MTCPDCERYRRLGKRFCGRCGCDLTSDGCPDCQRNAAMGHNFCSTCGAALNSTEAVTGLICPECERYRAQGSRFCGRCGSYLAACQVRPAGKDGSSLLKPCVLAACLIAAIELVFMWISAPYVVTSPGLSIDLIWLTPGPELLINLTGVPMWMLYLLECCIITLCAVVCLKRHVEETGRNVLPEDTALYRVPVLMGMILAAEYLIIFISMLFGEVTVDPELMDKSSIPGLVNAAVWEEVLVRTGLIGLPMAVIMLLVGRGDTDLPLHRYLLGGFGFSRLGLLLLILSSVVFGYGHIAWGVWKVLPAVITGLAMGYVFIEHGLYASILMHMLLDLSVLPFYYGFGFTSFMIIIMMLLALPGYVVYGRKALNALKKGSRSHAER